MDGASNIKIQIMRTEFWPKNLKGTDHLVNLNVDVFI